MFLNFLIIQAAPGGPVQQIISKLRGQSSDFETRFGDDNLSELTAQTYNTYGGDDGIDTEFLKHLEKEFGFDKPLMQRFSYMINRYIHFDLGESYFKHTRVWDLIIQKLPVSMSLGFWTMLLVYLISIPLGIKKAVRHGSTLDMVSSFVVILAYAIPSYLLALFLITFFAGGGVFEFFPLRGLVSHHFEMMTFFEKCKDYVWHLILPLIAMTFSGFAKITFLTKNAFLEEMNKPYVLTARAKGLSQKKVLYNHILRNALVVILAGAPATLLSVLFTSSLLIEVLFSLDGLGLLGFEAALNRDYPVMFGCLYVFTLVGMVLHLISDLCVMSIDRRIDLTKKQL